MGGWGNDLRELLAGVERLALLLQREDVADDNDVALDDDLAGR